MSTYLYICSAARSGSTLLDMLIGGHSRGASLGEFSFFGKALKLNQTCGCGNKIHDCESWNKIINRVERERGINLIKDPYTLRQWDTNASKVIDYEQQTHLYLKMAKLRSLVCKMRFATKSKLRVPLPLSLKHGVENTLYLYNVILEEWDKSFVIDSSKNMNKAIALYDERPSQTKIILLTRDGRGVFHSRFSSGFSRKQSLDGWRRYYSYALKLLKNNVKSEDLLILKYEDLVSDLEGNLIRICDFIGEDFNESMLDLATGTRHLVNGNNTMFKRSSGVNYDGRWKTELSEDDLRWFMKRAATLNQAMGYT